MDDALDLAELVEAGDWSQLVDEDRPLEHRSDSDLSLKTSSTEDALVFRRGPQATPSLVIEAFCTFNASLVHIDYPGTENGWTYRPDLGGHSMHRWDLGNDVCLVARHSTCSKAMRPRSKPCRNCEMKKTWRRECREACNTFFLFALSDLAKALALLRPLVLQTHVLSSEDVALYTNFTPKLCHARKRGREDMTKMQRMVHLEQNLRFSILNGASGRASVHRSAGDELFKLLLDADDEEDDEANANRFTSDLFEEEEDAAALGDADAADAADDDANAEMVAVPPMMVSDMVTIPVPSKPLLATPVARRMIVTPILATVVSSPLRKRNLAVRTYDAIVDRLIDHESDMSVLFTREMTQAVFLPCGLHGVADTVNNEFLDHLYAVLNIAHSPMLLVKSSILQLWLVHIVARDTRVYTGFLSMPSVQAYQEMRSLPLLPTCFTQSEVIMHASYDAASLLCAFGTFPVLCAYHSPHAPRRVYSDRVLPLGV